MRLTDVFSQWSSLEAAVKPHQTRRKCISKCKESWGNQWEGEKGNPWKQQDALNSFFKGNCSNSTQPPGLLVDLETICHTIGQRHGLDLLTIEQISLFLRVKGWRFPYLTCKTEPGASTVDPCCWRTKGTNFILHTVVCVDVWFHWLQPSSGALTEWELAPTQKAVIPSSSMHEVRQRKAA